MVSEVFEYKKKNLATDGEEGERKSPHKGGQVESKAPPSGNENTVEASLDTVKAQENNEQLSQKAVAEQAEIKLESGYELDLKPDNTFELQNEESLELDFGPELELRSDDEIDLKADESFELQNEESLELDFGPELELRSDDEIDLKPDESFELKDEESLELNFDTDLVLSSSDEIDLKPDNSFELQDGESLKLDFDDKLTSNTEGEFLSNSNTDSFDDLSLDIAADINVDEASFEEENIEEFDSIFDEFDEKQSTDDEFSRSYNETPNLDETPLPSEPNGVQSMPFDEDTQFSDMDKETVQLSPKEKIEDMDLELDLALNNADNEKALTNSQETKKSPSKKQKKDVKKTTTNSGLSTGGSTGVLKVCLLSSVITTSLLSMAGFTAYTFALKDTLATKDDIAYEISVVQKQIKKGTKDIESTQDNYITKSEINDIVASIDKIAQDTKKEVGQSHAELQGLISTEKNKVSALGRMVGDLENENANIRNDFSDALQDLKTRAISDETARKASVLALMKLEEAEERFNVDLAKISNENKADSGEISVKINELRAELLNEIEEVYIQADKGRRLNEDLYNKYNELSMSIDTKSSPTARPNRTIAGALGIDVSKGSVKPTYNLSGVVNGKVFINLSEPGQAQKIVTYYVGDYIDGYGKILSVSSISKEVMTESGKVRFQ